MIIKNFWLMPSNYKIKKPMIKLFSLFYIIQKITNSREQSHFNYIKNRIQLRILYEIHATHERRERSSIIERL